MCRDGTTTFFSRWRLKKRLELQHFEFTFFDLQVRSQFDKLLLLPLNLLFTMQLLLFQLVLQKFNLLKLSVEFEF